MVVEGVVQTLVEGLDHPECVAYGPDGFVYAGGEAGQIYRIDMDARHVAQLATTDGWVLGIASDAEANLYACDPKNHALMLITGDEHTVSVLSDGTEARAMFTPNYAVFDASGNLYVSDSGTWLRGDGCIYRINHDGKTEIWTSQCRRFPNGLAIDPAGEHLYVVESTAPGISRIPFLADGVAGTAEVLLELPDTVPDGIAFDESGRLYIGCYRPDRVYRFDPTDSSLTIVADDWQGTSISAPTNIAFAGPDLTQLLIASLGRWHIGSLHVDRPGAKLHYPQPLTVIQTNKSPTASARLRPCATASRQEIESCPAGSNRKAARR